MIPYHCFEPLRERGTANAPCKKLHPPVLTWLCNLTCVLSILSQSYKSGLLGYHHQRRLLYPNSSCVWPWARPHKSRRAVMSSATPPSFSLSIRCTSNTLGIFLLHAAYIHFAFSDHNSVLTDVISSFHINLFLCRGDKTKTCNVTWG